MLKRLADTARKRRRFSRCESPRVRIVGRGHRGIVGDRVQRTYLGGRLNGEDALVVMGNTGATTLSAVALVMNARVATLDTSSVLFMAIPPRGAMVHRAVCGCGSGCRVARRRATAVRKNAIVSGGAGRYGVASRQSASVRLTPDVGARSRARWPRARVTARGPQPIAGPQIPSGSGSARTGPAGAGEIRPAGSRER